MRAFASVGLISVSYTHLDVYKRQTENAPAIVGMAAALKEACALQKQHQLHLCAMRDKLIEGLDSIPHSLSLIHISLCIRDSC